MCMQILLVHGLYLQSLPANKSPLKISIIIYTFSPMVFTLDVYVSLCYKSYLTIWDPEFSSAETYWQLNFLFLEGDWVFLP